MAADRPGAPDGALAAGDLADLLVSHRGDTVQLEIWWDPIYPWCWFAHRRVAAALERCGRPAGVEVVWRSFEVLPDQPVVPGETASELHARWDDLDPAEVARRYAEVEALAAQEGIPMDLVGARPVTSFDAHRLVHLAAAHGLRGAATERLFAAYFADHANVADRDVLLAIARRVGLDGAEAEAVLAGDAFADAVRADERRAAELGIARVPTFLLDGELTPGVQSVAWLTDRLRSA